MARPTKLTPAFIEKAEEYLESWQDNCELIPSIAGMSVWTRVSRESLHTWYKKEWPEDASEEIRVKFSDIIDRLVSEQELRLLSGGLGGAMNSTITKLILHKHGYSEKQEVDNTSSDGSMGIKDLNITVTKPK